MDCSTIIVSYNTYDLTHAAVRTALTAAPGLEHEVIVVDNASPDGSGARLAAAFADDARVRVLALDENPGFSASNNRGAAVAAGRVLFFLNPDTVVHGDAVTRLVAYLYAHPEVGAVGPHVLNADGTDQASISAFPSYRTVALYNLALRPPPPRRDRPSPVEVIKGCALALRRDAFDRVGGWDERYFMYSEEIELCLALVRAGYRNVYLPDAVITHYGGQASLDRYAEQQLLAARSHTAFLRTHGSRGLVAFQRFFGMTGFAVRAVAFAVAARIRPEREDFPRRGRAASLLWRYYAFDHS